MLSTLEKISILKRASIFAELTDATLAEVAARLEPVALAPDQPLFVKGEPGSAMYLVVTGAVRIHDGDHTFSTLGEDEVFGEMALLDDEMRSASATAAGETLLLRLERETFLELLEGQGGMVRGILHVLAQRLRARSQELADRSSPTP